MHRAYRRRRRHRPPRVSFQLGKRRVRLKFTIKCSMSDRARRFRTRLDTTRKIHCDDETHTGSSSSIYSLSDRKPTEHPSRAARKLARLYSDLARWAYRDRAALATYRARRIERTPRVNATFATSHSRAMHSDDRRRDRISSPKKTAACPCVAWAR